PMRYDPFVMERWQSTYEHRVRFNLSESGVHPLSVDELLALAGADADALLRTRLGYGQSNGSDALRERIAALTPGAREANVLVTIGGAEANFAALWHLLEPGAPVAALLPNYMQVPGLAASLGAPVHGVPLVEDAGWQPDLDALDDALARGARFVLVTNPNNPTGAVLTPESMDGIVAAAERHGAWILADEVYRGAELDGEETPSFWGRSERVLVTNSLSKAYGLPGLRLGWVLGPEGLMEDLWGRTDYTTIAPASLSDALACLALEPATRARILERTRGILRENLQVLAGWIARQGGLFSYRPPDAGAICYVRYDAPVNSSELAERLRVEKSLLVVPGDHFGMDGYLRLGYGPPRAELEEALGRLEETFTEVLSSP
ncbi:MAG: aminotransferase class I/II-fold pyridoxal phosphate-dependent enzyme, partial [Gemmatimonadetes bacterium]